MLICLLAQGLFCRSLTPYRDKMKGMGIKSSARKASNDDAHSYPNFSYICLPNSGKPAPARFLIRPRPASAEAEYTP